MKEEWISANIKSNPRDPGEDGQIVDLEEPFTMADGAVIIQRDQAEKGSQVINCRCTLGFTEPKRDADRYLIIKNSYSGQSKCKNIKNRYDGGYICEYG
jgi:hypothetical protein